MVVFVDLDAEGQDLQSNHVDAARGNVSLPVDRPVTMIQARGQLEDEPSDGRENPNINGFSAALSCYPIVKQVTRSLDLNTLHALSRTCRQFRANLLQFRHYLVKRSLRCQNDESLFAERMRLAAVNGEAGSLGAKDQFEFQSFEARRLTSGKVGKCARDMVGECRKCGAVVCRNCIIKAPSQAALVSRHRRLCAFCLAVPLSCHTTYPSLPFLHGLDPHAFTAPAFARTACSCTDAVWLCQPCGQSLRSADTTYQRVWTWRTRYSTYLGGLGTGIGEGNEGVKCGRGEQCLAAKDIEVELDCCSDGLALLGQVDSNSSESSDEDKPGYLRQEIEGIGGVVKKKVKKRVRVGATVREHEDERERAGYLEREAKGQDRSWCGWCSRVIPGVKDLDP